MKKSLLKTALAALALAFIFAACSNASSPESESGKSSKPVVQSDPALAIPLTLEAIENTTITLSNTDLVENLKYSINGGGAEDVPSSESIRITLLKDSYISFYGEGTSNTSGKYFNINCSADCYVYGNIMSLLSSDFKDKTEITKGYAFCKLFCSNTHIKNKAEKELLLPATSLAEDCYSSMFSDCTSLTEAPALPATKLADRCYYEMFSCCTSLETAPALPATSLVESCYYSMFYGCTSLTKAPALPAENLALGCYSCMFSGCTSLTEAPALPAKILAKSCYIDMFYGCSSLTKAPELPATSLEEFCYYEMFSNCSSLNYVKCLATDISAFGCLDYWLDRVASTGTFEKAASMTTWPSGRSGIPSGWTVTDAD